ncbi:hypothetical protein [Methanolapillus millepedarum]|uniref:Uncharacterized protein n=1 Tax=Methanolapillus millepedarum TaxID=3028296 RepID=A0AA96V4C2_9EURY|nr:hypothetical protein MsAc7_10480 [Methanosarcinaceae archaeon Ac7]
MKINKKLIGVLLLILVFAAGCLSLESYVRYDYGSKTAELQINNPDDIFSGEDVERFYPYQYITNISYAYWNKRMMESECPLIVYGTVKEIKPSVWNTSDGKIPPEVEDMLDRGEPLWSPRYEIHTEMVVTVDRWAKGNSSEEITIQLYGGQVDNIVQYRESWPHSWDFKEGEQYLFYLVKQSYYPYYELAPGDSVRIVTN